MFYLNFNINDTISINVTQCIKIINKHWEKHSKFYICFTFYVYAFIVIAMLENFMFDQSVLDINKIRKERMVENVKIRCQYTQRNFSEWKVGRVDIHDVYLNVRK